MKPIVIGAGLAGLTTALALAPMPVVLISSRKLGEACSSSLAQGGVAAALASNDAAAFHAKDTQKAGAGLCDADIVKTVTEDAAGIIAKLIKQGVAFDRDEAGHLKFGLEAAHSHRRIIHAHGDGTGAAIMQALIRLVRATSSIEVIENASVTSIVTDGAVQGVTLFRNGEASFLPAHHVVLATGGAGALWQHTTNPLQSWGYGLALAAKAGADLVNLEFMQFHPTAIDVGRDPMPLASEALRGEGTLLVDETGERFADELAPRDIVARAIAAHLNNGHKVFLDARETLGSRFAARFPAIYALCRASGIDPARQPIPVRPAAHYHMGGVGTDIHGRTNVKGLWACGEVAHTSLHGANRLASNSLLEAASFGQRVAEDIKNIMTRPRVVHTSHISIMPRTETLPSEYIRKVMSRHLGVVRDGKGIDATIDELASLAADSDAALVGLMIAVSASRRKESRGAHCRSDFPELAATAVNTVVTYNDVKSLFDARHGRTAEA